MSQITVSGHLFNLSGQPTAGAAVFRLTNFGDYIPRVLGTNAIVPIVQTFQANSSGFWTGTVTGNDTIDPGASNNPPTTYYAVTFVDASGKVVQSLPFQFTGSTAVNLDSQTPISVSPAAALPATTAVLSGTQTWTGTNTFSTIYAQQIDTVLFADQFAGSDIGAQINAAYAAGPASPSCFVIVLPTGVFNFSTPITLTSVGKACILQGQGCGQASSTAQVGGTVLNYTPTTSSIAISLDWTPSTGGGFAPGAGLRDFTLTNGNPFNPTVGGTGSSAVGIEIGTTNGGAHKGLFSNIRIMGFGTGIHVPDNGGASWGMLFANDALIYNTTGISFAKTEEQIVFLQTVVSENTNGIVFVAGNADITFLGGSIDSNTTMGVQCNSAGTIFNAIGTHWENLNISGTPNYFAGSNATLNIHGGLALNDNSTGSAGSWFTANVCNVYGLSLDSAGASQSNFVFNIGGYGHVSVEDVSESLALNLIAFMGTATLLDITSSGGAVASGPTPAINTINSVLQTANIGTSTLFSVPISGAGLYRVTGYVVLTRAATSSSTLPALSISWIDQDTSNSESATLTVTNTANTVGTIETGSAILSASNSSTVHYSTGSYASSGATSMEYSVRIKIEYLGF